MIPSCKDMMKEANGVSKKRNFFSKMLRKLHFRLCANCQRYQGNIDKLNSVIEKALCAKAKKCSKDSKCLEDRVLKDLNLKD